MLFQETTEYASINAENGFFRDLTNLLNIDYSHNYLSNSKEIGNNALRNPNV